MNSKSKVSWQRLDALAPLTFNASSCLPLRSRYGECRRCVETCPVKALDLNAEQLTLSEGCLGCGHCAVVCPTGALVVDGFLLNDIFSKLSKTEIYVDCLKVPPESSPIGSMRVPCLGGVSLSDLLTISVIADGQPVTLLDRNWCSECPVGAGRAHPAHAVLTEARAWLSELLVPEEEQPRLVRKPLPYTLQRAQIAEARHERLMSRRGFFDQLVGETMVVTQLAMDDTPVAGADCKKPVPSTVRDRLYTLLNAIAIKRGQDIPARFFPTAAIDNQRCQYSSLCAAQCPTKALRTYKSDGKVGVELNAVACIACGQCERACPEQAFTLHSTGDGIVPQLPVVLSQHHLSVCAECGRDFVDDADESMCLSCRRSLDLAATAYRTLFKTQSK